MIKVEHGKIHGYSFRVVTSSGNTLLKSVPFSNKKELRQTVNELSKDMMRKGKVERRTNHQGQFLFQLKSNSGKLLGTSGLYASEAGMENGIKNLYSNLRAGPIRGSEALS